MACFRVATLLLSLVFVLQKVCPDHGDGLPCSIPVCREDKRCRFGETYRARRRLRTKNSHNTHQTMHNLSNSCNTFINHSDNTRPRRKESFRSPKPPTTQQDGGFGLGQPQSSHLQETSTCTQRPPTLRTQRTSKQSKHRRRKSPEPPMQYTYTRTPDLPPQEQPFTQPTHFEKPNIAPATKLNQSRDTAPTRHSARLQQAYTCSTTTRTKLKSTSSVLSLIINGSLFFFLGGWRGDWEWRASHRCDM